MAARTIRLDPAAENRHDARRDRRQYSGATERPRTVRMTGEEDAAIAGEGFFERTNGGFAADDEGRHHVREDHHLADGHHREFALGAVEDVAFFVCHNSPIRRARQGERCAPWTHGFEKLYAHRGS